MTLDAAELNQVTQIAARVAAEVTRNAWRGTGGATLPLPVSRLGIIGGTASAGAECSVRADGDEVAVPAVNLTGMTLEAGDRVMVEWRIPAGVYVTHTLSRAERGNWTPTVIGGTNGAGTRIGHYTRIGHKVTVYGKWEFGAGAALTSPTVWGGLPFPAISDDDGISALLNAFMYDISFPRRYFGVWEVPEGNDNGAVYVPADLGDVYHINTATSTTAPFTWTTADYIIFHGTYDTDAA